MLFLCEMPPHVAGQSAQCHPPGHNPTGMGRGGTGLSQSLGAIVPVGQGTGQRRCPAAVVMVGPRLEQPGREGTILGKRAAGGSCLVVEIREPGDGM